MSTFKNNNNLDSGSMAETQLCRRKRRRGYPYLYLTVYNQLNIY